MSKWSPSRGGSSAPPDVAGDGQSLSEEPPLSPNQNLRQGNGRGGSGRLSLSLEKSDVLSDAESDVELLPLVAYGSSDVELLPLVPSPGAESGREEGRREANRFEAGRGEAN